MMYNKTNIFNSGVEIAERFKDNLYEIVGAEYLSIRDGKAYFLNAEYEAIAVMDNLLSRDYRML